MLELKNISARYGAVQALHGVDMDVKAGEIVTLIGANGAGKTTLMMTMFGQPRAAGGTIRFEGEDILKVDEKRLRELRKTRFSMVFQHFAKDGM